MRCSNSLCLLALLIGPGCFRAAKLPGPELAELSPVALDPKDVLSAGASELDASVRLRSLGLLVRYVKDEGGGAWAPRALYDPNPAVQSEGVRALLSRSREPRSIALLQALAAHPGTDPYVRGHAAFELALMGDNSALASLQQTLAEPHRPYEQAPLALAAARMGDSAALAPLIAALQAGEFPLEIPFFLDCGRSGLTELVAPLAEASQHVEEELVLPIAAALLLLGDSKGEALFRDALGSKNIELRLEAVDYLSESTAAQAPDLLQRARNGGPAPVRDWATLALVSRGLERPELALDAMASPDRELRQQGAWALSRAIELEGKSQKAKDLRHDMTRGLYDPDTPVVIESARGFAAVGQPEDCPALSGLLVDQPLGVQIEAAGAMLAIERRTGRCTTP